MSRITGLLNFDFETDKSITEEQFDKFKREIKKVIDDWEMSVYEAASNNGFEADNIHPIMLENLECDFDY